VVSPATSFAVDWPLRAEYFSGHRLARIGDQVAQHLLQMPGVDERGRQIVRKLGISKQKDESFDLCG
jgi:hypothetical protein